MRLDNDMVTEEGDALCLFGGAPKLPELSEGYVANGTDHLAVHVETSPVSVYELEVGYVVDGNGADHEAAVNKTIQWLEPVPPGETTNLTVEVALNQTEIDPEVDRWDFYARFTPPGDQEACYTGESVGPKVIHIDAVRAGAS